MNACPSTEHKKLEFSQFYAERLIGIAETSQSFGKIAVEIRVGLNGDIISPGDGQVDDLASAIRKFCRAGLADTGEDAGEILIVLHGHQPIQRHNGQRRMLTCLIASFLVCTTRCRQRIDNFLGAKRSSGKQADLFRLHVPTLADPIAIDGPDIFDPGRESRAFSSVAEDDSSFTVVIGLRHKAPISAL